MDTYGLLEQIDQKIAQAQAQADEIESKLSELEV